MTRLAPALALLVACGPPGGGPPDPTPPPAPTGFVDLDPDPHVFEAVLEAREADVTVGGEVLRMLTFGGTVPGPAIHVTQGDRVVIHVENALPDLQSTQVHWHGIEGTNAMDGTQVTQTPIATGQTFTYDFRVPRPGIFWYHPHAHTAQPVFAGMYGALVVDDPDDAALTEAGVLPRLRQVLVLSDTSDYEGQILSVETDNAMEIMNGTEGETLLVNGQVNPTIEVPAGDGVRFQVINTSITRFWRLVAPGHTLYRVGGEGGLLDRARVEGGVVAATVEDETGAVIGATDVDLGFARGELLLGPAERADVVIDPDGQPGDTIELRWEDFARGRHGMWMEGDQMVMGDAEDDGARPGRVVATLRLVEGAGTGFAIAEGDPVLAAVGRSVEVLPELDDVTWTGAAATVLDEDMPMWQDAYGVWQMETEFFVDGVSWHPQEGGPTQALAPTARTARLGDTLLWEIHNRTGMVHPFHLHGFSYQPLAFVRADTELGHAETPPATPPDPTFTRWPVPYAEFEDTTNLPPHTSMIVRVRLDDPNGDGGGAGRWLEHCHILQHGANGMMSELVVEP